MMIVRFALAKRTILHPFCGANDTRRPLLLLLLLLSLLCLLLLSSLQELEIQLQH